MENLLNAMLQSVIALGIFGVSVLGKNLIEFYQKKKAAKSVADLNIKFSFTKLLAGILRSVSLGVGLLLITLALQVLLSDGAKVDVLGFTIEQSTVVFLLHAASIVQVGSAILCLKDEWDIDDSTLEKYRAEAENYQKVLKEASDVAIETITKICAKDDIGEIGTVLDEAGMGGLSNNYPEPYRSAAQDSLIDPSSMYNRECTSWSAWMTGWSQLFKRTAGRNNAKDWLANASRWGIPTGKEPAVGATACWLSGQYGHVAHVEAVNAETVVISEYNYVAMGTFSVREIPKNAPDGYIYWNGAPTATPVEVPAKVTPTVNVVPNNPVSSDIKAGDTVVAWGVGTADSYGGGAQTRSFPETMMKVIGINNGRYALNQYNSGTIGNVADTTGWWPKEQVRKA